MFALQYLMQLLTFEQQIIFVQHLAFVRRESVAVKKTNINIKVNKSHLFSLTLTLERFFFPLADIM